MAASVSWVMEAITKRQKPAKVAPRWHCPVGGGPFLSTETVMVARKAKRLYTATRILNVGRSSITTLDLPVL